MKDKKKDRDDFAYDEYIDEKLLDNCNINT